MIDKNYWMDKIRHGCPLDSVPMELLDDFDFCWNMVRWLSVGFNHISDRLKGDYDFCLKAIRSSPEVIQYIPVLDVGRHYNLCLEAVGLDGWALNLIPKEFKNREICMAAVNQNWKVFGFVPLEIRDFDFCLAARIRNKSVYFHIPLKWRRKVVFLARLLEVGDYYSLIMGEKVIYG